MLFNIILYIGPDTNLFHIWFWFSGNKKSINDSKFKLVHIFLNDFKIRVTKDPTWNDPFTTPVMSLAWEKQGNIMPVFLLLDPYPCQVLLNTKMQHASHTSHWALVMEPHNANIKAIYFLEVLFMSCLDAPYACGTTNDWPRCYVGGPQPEDHCDWTTLNVWPLTRVWG